MEDESQTRGAPEALVSAAEIDLDLLLEEAHEHCAYLWRRIGVPDDVWTRCGSAAWCLHLANNAARESDQELRDRAQRLQQEGSSLLAELRAAAPGVPESALESLSLASGTIAFMQRSFDEEKEPMNQSWARVLNVVFLAMGHALGSTGAPSKAVQDLLGRIGARGAEAKHAGTRALKAWALAQAATMKGADKAVARELAVALPAEFVRTSEDPERLIYDALRAQRRRTAGGSRNG